MDDLNQEPPDFKSSALNHSVTLPPRHLYEIGYPKVLPNFFNTNDLLMIISAPASIGSDWLKVLYHEQHYCNHRCKFIIIGPDNDRSAKPRVVFWSV